MVRAFVIITAVVAVFSVQFSFATDIKLSLTDSSIDYHQHQLLDLAFETASLIPLKPHIKDRSRKQEEVILACLELGLPNKALGLIPQIENWREGACYADLAIYCINNGDNQAGLGLLPLAKTISSQTEDWRRDRIRVKIAKAYTLLGENEKAQQFNQDVDDSESGKVIGAQASLCDNDTFDETVAALDQQISMGIFDLVKNSLFAYKELFKCFYNDETKRELIYKKIVDSWSVMPQLIRIQLLEQLAEIAIEHADYENAIRHINRASQALSSQHWPQEHQIPAAAQLARLRHRAGDTVKAKADADQLKLNYKDNRESIVNIWRAGALRPLAEAYHAMGDKLAANQMYQTALDESVENPNSRPRAEDLISTCVSMALHSFEPDDELWQRIKQIYKHLGQPW